MAEASAPGTTVSAPCDLAQLTTPTYARGRLAKLRRDAGGKGSGRCEMARVALRLMSSHALRHTSAWREPGALLCVALAWRCGLLSAHSREARH